MARAKRLSRGIGTALAALILLAASPTASSSHSMPGPDGTSVQFDHDGDNEWWVEVLTRPGSGTSVVAMQTYVETGGSHPMRQEGMVGSWTKWVPSQSFRVPSGARVQFEAHVVDSEGDAATIRSCWFTHPAGVEQCDPAPTPWQVSVIGEAGFASGSGDVAVGDADNDGRRDVTVANRNGVFHFEWTGSGWTQQRVGTLAATHALAVGDGDGDGKSEIHTVSNSELWRFTFVNGAWAGRVIATFSEPFAKDMTIARIDHEPGPEIYVGTQVTTFDPDTGLATSSSTVHKVSFVNGAWADQPVLMRSGHLESLWVADADNNGKPALYIGHGTRHASKVTQLDFDGGFWRSTELPGTGSGFGESYVVAGDGDGDGKQEVYAISDQGELRRIRLTSSGWVSETLAFRLVGPNGNQVRPVHLALGDGESDGKAELYIGDAHQGVIQGKVAGSALTVSSVLDPVDPTRNVHADNALVAIGDGDGDGRREVYAALSFQDEEPGDDGVTRVYQAKKTAAGFDATFTGVRGNEWWIQANVAASGGTLAKVDVRLNGGDWKPLAKQSWGGWAASYRAVQGTIVQFRATSTTGATDLSDCYQWIPASGKDASKVSCTPAAFDATFSSAKGNDWWVEVTVKGNQPIAKVEARVNCGGYTALAKTDWGSWAKSFHVPSGSKVTFRATSSTGATDASGGYVWPQATPTSGC